MVAQGAVSPHQESFDSISIAWLVLAVLCIVPLRFSATAVLPSLVARWDLTTTGAAWMTGVMQLGFFVGAIGFAALNVSDIWSPRRVFAANAIVGALANAALVLPQVGIEFALCLRFITGVCLAGVYPPSIKIAVGLVSAGFRGRAVSAVVAATTFGTGVPFVLTAIWGGGGLAELPVILCLSFLAAAGGIIGYLIKEGPYAAKSARFDPYQIVRAFRDRPVLLTGVGYVGHMWELYGFWAWVVVFLTAAVASSDGGGEAQALVVAFVTVSIASPIAALSAGWLADRHGRAAVTIGALSLSAVCCLLSPLLVVAPTLLLFGFVVVWGMAAVADSSQFSAAASELANPEYVGTVLALQQGIGFAITMVPLWAVPVLAEQWGWRYAFVLLGIGPAIGCIAMIMLRRRPESLKLAQGRR